MTDKERKALTAEYLASGRDPVRHTSLQCQPHIDCAGRTWVSWHEVPDYRSVATALLDDMLLWLIEEKGWDPKRG